MTGAADRQPGAWRSASPLRSIRARILAGFLLVGGLLGAVSVAVWRASGELEAALGADAASQRAAQENGLARTKLLEMRLGIVSYLHSGGAAESVALVAAVEGLERAVAAADDSLPGGTTQQPRLALARQVRAELLSVAAAIEQQRVAKARLDDAAAVLGNSATALAEAASRTGRREAAEPAASLLSAVSRTVGASIRYASSQDPALAEHATAEAARARALLDGLLGATAEAPRLWRITLVTSEALSRLGSAVEETGAALVGRGELLGSLATASERLAAATERASAAVAAERLRRRAEIIQAQAALRATVVWATAAAGLVGLSVAGILVVSITRSTRRLAAAMASIGEGALDHAVPDGGGDELGQLLAATEVKRSRIRAMVEREVEARRSAQNRLVDALEGSGQGVVLVDNAGHLVLCNSQVARFYPAAARLLQPGAAFTAFASATGTPAAFAAAPRGGNVEAPEVQLADGRWVHVRRCVTQDGGFAAIISEITALKEREAELRETNGRFDTALENMSQGLAMFDAGQRLQVGNRRLSEICRLPPESIRAGATLHDLLALSVAVGNHGGRALQDVHANFQGMIAQKRRCTVVQPIGDRVVAISHQPMADGGWIATYDDVTERQQAEAQVAYLAHHDTLTGVPNRTLLRDRLDQAVAGLARGTGFAVMCLDLDGFKPVNDTLGHPADDGLLRAVAERLTGCVRATDTVARLGGDEFAIVQTGIAGPGCAAELAARLVDAVGQPCRIEGQVVSVGASVGIAVAPEDGSDWDTLLKRADLALYRAKQDGRGTYRLFDPDMNARLQQRRLLEAELGRALPSSELEVFYQPQVCLASGRLTGFEALLRWRHPERGMVGPGEFIPVAEETGLIVPIGEWVLRQACADAAAWPDEAKVAVNVSAAQFKEPRLVGAVVDALARSGLPARRLELEITESVLLREGEATLATLHELRRLGTSIALDDFGTGYSSLSYLCSFPFDKLKIDQSFVRGLGKLAEATTIVRAVCELGTGLGMRITAEGVETEEQVACLRNEGCTEAQGYLFSRPVPGNEVVEVLERIGTPRQALAA